MGSRFQSKTPSVVCTACMVVMIGAPALAEPAANDVSLNVPAAPVRITENSLLYLQPRLGDLPSSRKTLDVLEAPGQVFLPFQELISLFGFAIDIRADGSASGTAFSKDSVFDFTFAAREVRLGDHKTEVTRQHLRRVDGRVFVSCEALAEWFGIKSVIDRVHYTIRFTAPSKFPDERKADRRRAWAEAGLTAAPASSAWGHPARDSTGVATTHDFKGTAAPRTDVELYHNGKLAAATVADAQGAYVFSGIPVFFGDNIYRFKHVDNLDGTEERTEAISTPLPKSLKVAAPIQAVDSDPVATKAESRSTRTEKSPAQTIPLANLVALQIVKDQASLGAVEAFIDKQHTFVPLAATLGLLGFAYLPATDANNAEIVLKDGSTVALDFEKREYVAHGQRHSFYYYDTYQKDGAWYANIEFLNRVLPETGLVVDLGMRRVTITHGRGLFGLWDSAPTPADFAPPPTAAPRSPVIIDDTAPHAPADSERLEPQPEAQDVITTVDESQPSLPPPGPPHIPENAPLRPEPNEEGESLILLARIKKLPPSDEFIEALDTPGQVFLPFNEILQLFEFPIKVDGAMATGFFFTSGNVFYLDVEKGEVRAGDLHRDITAQDFRRRNGQIYISTDALAEWFGITSTIDRADSSIHFMTDRLLPREEREDRQKRWNIMLRDVEKTEKDFPVLQNPYQGLGIPTVDVNLGATYLASGGTEAQSSLTSTYNLRAAGDVAHLTGQVYAQGTTDGRALDNLRLSAGRKDAGANLLGGLRATEFAFGDVTSPSASLLTANSLGRGLMVTNRDIGAAENFDYRNFSGDSVPGYEVELYRNDVLMAFQTVDASGRYNFPNIPILYGENIFRIVFYGQQGQREERIERVSANNSLLRKNQFAYTFGVEQRGTPLIPETSNAYVNPATPNGLQAVADLRYGLSENVTMGAAFAETQLADGAHRYLSTSLGANVAGVLTESTLAHDMTNQGWAGSVAALGGFDGVSLRLRYRTFDDFLSEAVNANGQPLRSDAGADLNTQIYLPWFGSYSVGLSAVHEKFADPQLHPRTTFSWRSSKSIGGVSFTESAEWVIDDEKRLQDTFSVQTRLFNIDWRAVGVMGVQPDQRLREASFMADYFLTDKLSGQTQFDKDMTTNRTTWGQNLSWDFDDFRLSFTGQMSDTRNYSLGLNLIFSAIHDATADTWRFQGAAASDGGSISGRAFIDENRNGKRDEGEAVVPNAKVRAEGALVRPDADVFFAASVDPYRTTRLRLDPSSIADPLLTPSTLGYQVITRPGDNVTADFPLVRTTIVDGTVSFIDESGNRRELSNIVIELRDSGGKPLHRVISAIDGYFSFDKIPAGDYILTVPQEALDSFNASLEAELPINIETIDEFMTGYELKLHQKAKLDAPPPMQAPPLPRAEPSAPGAPSAPLETRASGDTSTPTATDIVP